MVDDGLPDSSDLTSPGAMLKAARKDLEISEREAADRLNWMPGYVAIIERDEYAALRRPSFAKGYVKAFGRLVELDEEVLMAAFGAIETRGLNSGSGAVEKSTPTALPPHRTGLSIVVGLCSLFLLFAILWWWQGNLS